MTNKLKELMELSKAVDVICNEVDKSNKEKEARLKTKLHEQWCDMWKDLKEIIPAIQSMKLDDGTYIGNYVYGYDGIHKMGITFIYHKYCPITIMFDVFGGWTPAQEDKYDWWIQKHAHIVKLILRNWQEIYTEMQEDIAKRLGENIKKRTIECQKRTEKLDMELAERR